MGESITFSKQNGCFNLFRDNFKIIIVIKRQIIINRIQKKLVSTGILNHDEAINLEQRIFKTDVKKLHRSKQYLERVLKQCTVG